MEVVTANVSDSLKNDSKEEKCENKYHPHLAHFHIPVSLHSHLLPRPTQKRIILMGPPASGKSTLSPLLAEKLGVVHVRKNNLLHKEVNERTPEGIEITQWRVKNPREADPTTVHAKKHKVPIQFFIRCFNKRFSQCGWVLEGGPKAESHFHFIKNAGIFPHKVVYLDVPLEVRLKRIRSRRVDPVTDRTYNLELNPPEDQQIINRLIARHDDGEEYFKSRLEKYEKECKKVVFMYPPEMLKIVRADRPISDLLEEILQFISN